MSYKLQKPYTNKEKADFIVKYNHQQGLKIEETNSAIYALEPWELLKDGTIVDNSEEYEKEQAKKERERLDNLSLTAADVERAIYKAKGMDFDDLLAFVSQNPPEGLDLKALKIELKANNFYRGNPYINAVGTLLGFSGAQLDEFFETGDYEKLLPIEAKENEDITLGADTTMHEAINEEGEDDTKLVKSTEQDTPK